jgi:hypothetical protein
MEYNSIPKPNSPVLDRNGHLAREWYDYFRRTLSPQDISSIEEELIALQKKIDSIDSSEFLKKSANVVGEQSVQSTGSLSQGLVRISLQGDIDQPGPGYFYGTDKDGVKTWVPAPNPFQGKPITDQAGEPLTDQDGSPILSNTPLIPLEWIEKGPIFLQSIVAGGNVVIDYTDPFNPVVSATSSGGSVTSVNARTGVVSVPDYFPKATTPNSSDFGRAIINGDRWRNTTNGLLYTYQDGAWLYDNAASLSRYVPAYLRTGASTPIPLNADGSVPAYLRNGTPSNIPMQA